MMEPECSHGQWNPSDLDALDDESFLDELFDRAVELAPGGGLDELRVLAVARPHLREAIEETLRTAGEIAVRKSLDTPRIDGYTIVRELGQGAMGRVWLAEQEALGHRPVALKVLPSSLASSRRARSRFLAEARAIARVHHDHVVAIHDVIEREDLVAYAMEWVDGRSLAELIVFLRPLRATGSDAGVARVKQAARHLAGETATRLPTLATSWPQLVARIGIDVARALAAVHATGLVHRDVKPSNILLRRDGTALLSDFGLVRDVESSHHTLTGEFVGTLAFASPEVLRGEHAKVDARSDVFSLGATVYQALCLELPFGNASPAVVQSRVENGAFVSLRKLDPRLPRDLETIVTKSLDPDPARRYASADELAEDLERLLALQPIHAKRAGMIARALKSVRRNSRTFFGSLAGTLVGLVAAGLLAAWIFDRSRRPVRAAEHLRNARFELIGMGIANKGFLGKMEQGATIRFVATPSGGELKRLERALVEYDHGLALAPDQTTARAERDLIAYFVAQAKAPAENPADRSSHVEPTAFLAGACPNLTRALRDSLGDGFDLPGLAEIVAGASAADRRSLGLAGFLYRSAPLCVEAWEALDLDRESDALVDGLIGSAYLASGRLELAYVRLVRALDQYPESAVLDVLVADAAVRLEDYAVARRSLERCDASQLDPLDTTYERVEGDLHWAEGRLEEASRVYRAAIRPGKDANPIIRLRRAHLAELQADFDGAWREHLANAAAWPIWFEPRQGVHRCAEAWWRTLSEAERERVIRAAAQDLPRWPDAWGNHALQPQAEPAGREEMIACGLLVQLLRFQRELLVEPYAPPLPDGPPFLWRFQSRGSAVDSTPGAFPALACTGEIVASDALWNALPRPWRERVLLAAYSLDRALATSSDLDPRTAVALATSLGRGARAVLAIAGATRRSPADRRLR